MVKYYLVNDKICSAHLDFRYTRDVRGAKKNREHETLHLMTCVSRANDNMNE